MTPAEKTLHKIEQMNRIVSLYKEGFTRNEIADITHYSYAYVNDLLKRAGYISDRKKHSYEDYRDRVEQMYYSGMEMLDIARELDVSVMNVRKWVNKIRLERKEKIEEEKEDFETLLLKDAKFAKPRPKVIYNIVINGKRYQDVTNLYIGG